MARSLLPLLALLVGALPLPAAAFEPTGNAVADGFLNIIESGGFGSVAVEGVANQGEATLISGLTATAPQRNEALTIGTITIVDGLIDARNGLRAEAIRYTGVRMTNTAAAQSHSTAATVTVAGPRLAQSAADASWLATVLGEFRALELEELLAHPANGREVRVARIAIVRNAAAGEATSGRIDFRGASVAGDFFEEPTRTTLADLGYQRLTIDGTLAGEWEGESGTIAISQASVAAEAMGAVSLALAATGLDPERMAAVRANIAKPAALLPLLQAVRIDTLTIALRDGGLTDKLIERAAARSGGDAQSVRERAVATADALLALVRSPELRQNGTDAVRRFLAEPGTLTLSVTPPEGVNAAQIVGGALLKPEALPALLDLKIGVQP